MKESVPADESRNGRGRDPVIDLNPQAAQMADESMVRTLAAQAQAIWPQEAPLLLRYRLPQEPAVLDAGCGTGEGASRLAELFGSARVLGVDIIDAHLDVARSRYARLAPRLSFSHQSLYALDAADEAFDLVACRHVLHSIPHTDRVLAELLRVTRRGGYVHIIAEDYGMIHFDEQSGVRDFWSVAPAAFGAATGTDLFVGRNIVPLLSQLDVDAITVDYAIVGTLRVAARDIRRHAGGVARRIRRSDRRAHAAVARSDGHRLRADDRNRAQSARLRGVDGADRQRAKALTMWLAPT